MTFENEDQRIDFLRDELNRSRLALVASVTGLHPHTLRNFIDKKKKPHESTLRVLEWYFEQEAK
jgi:hypothetical protein